MANDGVRIDIAGPVAWVTLQAEPLNILTVDLMTELTGVLREVATSEASVLVLSSGVPGVFSAGVDVAAHLPAQVDGMLARTGELARQLVAQPQTTVAAVDGAALGGGFELVLLCDAAVASERARLGLPEIKLGCFPPVATALLPRLCGRLGAGALILGGETLDAAAAQRLGLLSRVVAQAAYDNELREFVAGLSAHSAEVLRLTTRLLRAQALDGFVERLAELERAYARELVPLPDMAEGVRAFLDKRPPKWGGGDGP